MSSPDSKGLKSRTQALNYYTLETGYCFKGKNKNKTTKQTNEKTLIGKVKSRTATNTNQKETKELYHTLIQEQGINLSNF